SKPTEPGPVLFDSRRAQATFRLRRIEVDWRGHTSPASRVIILLAHGERIARGRARHHEIVEHKSGEGRDAVEVEIGDLGAAVHFPQLSDRRLNLRFMVEGSSPVAHDLLHRRLITDSKAVRSCLANVIGFSNGFAVPSAPSFFGSGLGDFGSILGGGLRFTANL